MGWIWFIGIGALAGWLAGQFMRGNGLKVVVLAGGVAVDRAIPLNVFGFR